MAAVLVGRSGSVKGIDMTDEQLETARSCLNDFSSTLVLSSIKPDVSNLVHRDIDQIWFLRKDILKIWKDAESAQDPLMFSCRIVL
jgi:hypothetical protein